MIFKLEGTVNTRELGGYVTEDGKMTCPYVFLRSDDTDELSDRDIQYLEDYGIKTVIDLRSKREMLRWPDRLGAALGVKYYNVDVNGIYLRKEKPYYYLGGDARYLCYTGEGNWIKRVFDIIAKELPQGGVLFHCVSGKDRTGILSVLLLGLAGVSPEYIIANYKPSYDLIVKRPKIRQIMDESLRDGKVAEEKDFMSTKERINDVIEYVLKKFGTFENYLLECKIKTENLVLIKNKFVK